MMSDEVLTIGRQLINEGRHLITLSSQVQALQEVLAATEIQVQYAQARGTLSDLLDDLRRLFCNYYHRLHQDEAPSEVRHSALQVYELEAKRIGFKLQELAGVLRLTEGMAKQ